MASTKGCVHRQDKLALSPRRCPIPGELEGPCCVGAEQAEVENGQVRSVGGAQKRCAGNCFFPSGPEKVEQLLNTKRGEILSFISESKRDSC